MRLGPTSRCVAPGWSGHSRGWSAWSPGNLMSDPKDNAFVVLYLALTAVVTLGWIGVIGYGAWHFLFG